MNNVEIIIGPNVTLRLSLGTARLLYRGLLTFTAREGPGRLPERARAYIDRRRATLGCSTTPVDVRLLLSDDLDGMSQRSLAELVGRVASNVASRGWIEVGISPAVRIRLVAALIEVYRLLCANLPVDMTLPPPVGVSLPRRDWALVEAERARIRAESEGHALTLDLESARHEAKPDHDEIVHRQISMFAG